MSTSAEIYSAVTSRYSVASFSRTKSGAYESTVAKAFGYSPEELASIPSDSNLGLSCGNPLVLAALKPGEIVVDLGCGAGFDVFLASPKVGTRGKVIGVDMNKDMLAKAERNKAIANERGQAENVRFVQAPITDIKPLEGETIDCIISNCVVNLVPEEEKPLVFREMYRLLKKGGRVAISDILIKDGMELPENLKMDMELYVGCIAGASLVSGYERYLKEAGFTEILIVNAGKDLNVYNVDVDGADSEGKSCCGTSAPIQTTKSSCGTSLPVEQKSCCGTQPETYGASVGINLKSIDFNKYAGSYSIYAVKA